MSFNVVLPSFKYLTLLKPKAFSFSSKARDIKLYFAKDVCGGDWDAIRMGFAVFNEEELEPALEMFSRIWHEASE